MGRWPMMGRQVASRRTVLASLAGMVAAGAIAGCDSKHPSARGAAVTSEPPKPVSLLPVDHRSSFEAPGRPLAMAIVAHPDDDLFFMNPDTLHTIERGVPVVSVYVTGGGSFGVNQAPGEPKARPDVPAYVSARQQGLRQAYARMLGATLFTPWTRTALKLPGGREAELNVLEYNGRRAELIFLGVRMHEKTGRGWVGMTQLWNTPGVVLRTQPTPESPVQEKYTYSRDELTDALLFLMRKYRPTLVRTLDPDPDAQVHDKLHPRGSDQVGYSDHPDHTAVALFTWRALAQWGQGTSQGSRTPGFLTEAFRGYYNQRWPYNLPSDTVHQKTEYLNAYGGAPTWQCGNGSGCGDYSVGVNGVLKSKKGWVRSTHRRYPTAGPKVVVDKDGRMNAYAVLGTRAARWRESGPYSGGWGTAEDLGGGPLAPALSAVAAADGRHLVFGLRFTNLGASDKDDTREIVVLQQKSAGGDFEQQWTSLGNPETDPRRSRLTGPPTAIAAPDGTVHVFVRNAAKGVSTRIRDKQGTWSPWQKLSGGGQIQEGLAAAVDGDGRVHVFGSAFGWVEHWAQKDAGGAMVRAARGLKTRPGDAPDAVTAKDGSVLLAYHKPSSDQINVAQLRGGQAGRWTELPDQKVTGYGPVALVDGQDLATGGVMLSSRSGTGAIEMVDSGKQVTLHGDASSGFMVGAPAVVQGAGEGVALVTLGLNTTPAVTRVPPRAGTV
ncbi:PIG-L family deacetylase [Streptomyces sp. BPTC-684]|uniref:PIG-L family deacetylase n=1 Tax=Streptomyces sp. BPTC-684 TaxID=3043734 RepID=UPI0024B04A07|nr:PIG-L family deacetylase [Streptomyces sp. BPTC-684]WHM38766.1 PIG-L family deacetylase [Streptomyces sp. BPTC-684]